MTGDSNEAVDELRELYLASYSRLVRVVAAVTGDAEEAEDAVMDAFVRLMDVWPRISRYGDPEAWVRKVALGKVSNRRRKVRNGAAALLRLGAPAPVAGPTGDRVDIARAMATLSRAHREVIVLQHLGLDAKAIALELGIPFGTAKSRLARARSALALQLREDVHPHA